MSHSFFYDSRKREFLSWSLESGRPERPPSAKKNIGFTLIETMLVMMLMALLAGAVAMSFSRPLKSSRAADALEQLKTFDDMSRQAAISSGHNVRLVFDLADNSLRRRDDSAAGQSHVELPQGCRMDAVRIDDHLTTAGEAFVDISAHGWGKTYAVHLLAAGSDRWLVFAGMTGQLTLVQNESQIPQYHSQPRHHAD